MAKKKKAIEELISTTDLANEITKEIRRLSLTVSDLESVKSRKIPVKGMPSWEQAKMRLNAACRLIQESVADFKVESGS